MLINDRLNYRVNIETFVAAYYWFRCVYLLLKFESGHFCEWDSADDIPF